MPSHAYFLSNAHFSFLIFFSTPHAAHHFVLFSVPPMSHFFLSLSTLCIMTVFFYLCRVKCCLVPFSSLLASPFLFPLFCSSFCSYGLVNLITHYSLVSFEVFTLVQALLFSGPLCFQHVFLTFVLNAYN